MKLIARRSVLFIVLTAVCPVPAVQSDPGTKKPEQRVLLNLADVISTGLEQNLDLRMTRTDRDKAEIANSWGNAGALPRIDARAETYPWSSADEWAGLQAGVTGQWRLFGGLGVVHQKKILDQSQALSQEGWLLAIESTVALAIDRYLQLAVAEAVEKAAGEQKSIAMADLKQTESRSTMGLADPLEVAAARATMARIALREVQSSTELRLARQKMSELFASENLRLYSAEGTLADGLSGLLPGWDAPRPVTAEIIDLAGKSNIGLRSRLLEKEIASTQKRAERSGWSPLLEFKTGVAAAAGGPVSTGDSATWQAGLALTWNLFDGGRTRTRIRLAEQSVLRSDLELEKIKRQIKLEAAVATASWYEAREAALLAGVLQRSADQTLRLGVRAHELGRVDSIAVQRLYADALDAFIEEQRANANIIRIELAILRLTGQLTAQVPPKP